ncbi:hypothetical protein THARTR1_03958 [Trichoderma harzianum]|uniref:Uncharacterized protein n=1 Tax=Trichoderma harzianum TaxID=5544 RepID=A0A2K0UD83_TRIHA|nr:hypothetical protein THARTR1_03958 [Trichoderma harzianum]
MLKTGQSGQTRMWAKGQAKLSRRLADPRAAGDSRGTDTDTAAATWMGHGQGRTETDRD